MKPSSNKIYLDALDADAAGNWDEAHRLVQNVATPEAAWVHAYLHRVQGDLGNAAYWYSRANKPVCTASLESERTAIRAALADASALN